MTAPITVLGDVMVDVSARVSTPIAHASDTDARISMQLGGSGATTARWLAHAEASVHFIGCVGDDALGDLARRTLESDGVHAHLQVVGPSTGTCIVIVESDGERTMLPDPGANTGLDADAIPDDLLAGRLHVSGYTLLRPASRAVGRSLIARARSLGTLVSLDAASAAPLAASPDVVLDVLAEVDVLIANRDEAEVLTGTGDPEVGLARLADLVPTAVIKLGSAGAFAASGAERVRVPARAGDVLDTTGAGDAFAAGLLAAFGHGASLEEATLAGRDLAAVAVARVGAGPPPRAG